jgi:thiamine-phosphate pyrophosphorylase
MTATPSRAARLAASPLYLVATLPEAGASTTSAWLHRIAEAAAAGAGLVQLRAKDASTAARRELLAQLRSRLPADALLLVNDDLEAVLDTAGRPLADGVHLGREDAAALAGDSAAPGLACIAEGLRRARQRLGDELLLGTSARTQVEVAAAIEAGADYVGFGAMADSRSKRDTVRADPAELRRCVTAFPAFPIFPIGGLDLRQLDALVALGCRRAAIGSAILDADDPAAVAAACKARLLNG